MNVFVLKDNFVCSCKRRKDKAKDGNAKAQEITTE